MMPRLIFQMLRYFFLLLNLLHCYRKMTDTCNDGCICLPLIIVLSVQVDLVTSVPSRQPIDPPTSDQILKSPLNTFYKEAEEYGRNRQNFCHVVYFRVYYYD